jgi:hypothetical protein
MVLGVWVQASEPRRLMLAEAKHISIGVAFLSR